MLHALGVEHDHASVLLQSQQRLDRAALVHHLVALGGLLKWEGEVKDLAGVDLAVPDELDQVRQEPARGRRAGGCRRRTGRFRGWTRRS